MRKLNHVLKVLADEYTQTPSSEPVSEEVELLREEASEDLLESTPDDHFIYFVDVKKKFPAIADKLNKEFFQGKAKLQVKDLKKIIQGMDDDDRFWFSLDKWDGGRNLQKAIDEEQTVFQLNVSDKYLKRIKDDPILTDFFDAFWSSHSEGLHPMHHQTLGWARVYKFPDKWVIEEIQTDLVGPDVAKTGDRAAGSQINEILDTFEEDEQKEIIDFLVELFDDWDKNLVAALIAEARKNGVKDIYMFDDVFKAPQTQAAPSKLKRYYKVVPRDLGFNRTMLRLDDESISSWHRAVASAAPASRLIAALRTLAY